MNRNSATSAPIPLVCLLMSDNEKPTLLDICDLPEFINEHKDSEAEVVVDGWVDTVRKQKKLIFITLRDGDYVQVVFPCSTKLAVYHEILREGAVRVTGVPRFDERAPTGVEIRASSVVPVLPTKAIESINRDTGVFHRMNQRHLSLRSADAVMIQRVRSVVKDLLRQFFRSQRLMEVDPPTITQQSVEGGSTLFELKYYDEKAYMTQSSQLYLEAAMPMTKRVYCMAPSYRSEKSKTIRHLSEFMHCETELAFIDFDDLTSFNEEMVRYVFREILKHPGVGKYVEEHNPELKSWDCEFYRLRYSDAIRLCRENDIYKDDETKTHFDYGDDIPENPERRMVALIGKPTILYGFPVKMKSFYMRRDPSNPEETESLDILLPGVGEIVGGSMRIHNDDELRARMKEEGIPEEKYDWYIDQRVYGSTPHGGSGLGIERLVMAICKCESVRETCLFPRYVGRCLP